MKTFRKNRLKLFTIAIVLLISHIACESEKEEWGTGDLAYAETIDFGCISHKSAELTGISYDDPDRVTYHSVHGFLELTVLFDENCCSQFTTSSEVKSQTIIISINTTRIGDCLCMCNFEYKFRFSGDGRNYNYEVYLDSKLKFSGTITE